MIGRVYRLGGDYWRVVCRWRGKGPRNVLLERVEPRESTGPGGERVWHGFRRTGEVMVRPFRGLRRI